VGPGFVIIIWLIIAAFVGSIWLACLVAFIIGKLRKSRLLMWLGGIPLVLITVLVVGVVGLVGFGIMRATNPRYVYQDTFHEKPSSDVRHLKSRVWSFADEADVFMRFEASVATFHRILPPNMEKVSYADYKKRMPGNNLEPPPWWSPPTEATSGIYIRVPKWGHGERFASESTLISYDMANNTVMYFYLGID
jgi:hypothetical protein